MKKLIVVFLFCLLGVTSLAWGITAENILDKIDDNMVIENAVSISTMTIHSRMGTRNIQSKSWMGKKNKAFVEYLSPAREKGKKMLKTEDKLWIFTPEPNERIISISGHLLRQSVMGSDLSYEDYMENDVLVKDYEAEILGSEKVKERDCYVLHLVAKSDDVNYHSRKIWVDKQRWLAVKEQRYAKSGKLLKKTEILDVFRIKDRWYPKRIKFKDVLSRGKGTVMVIDSLTLDVEIPEFKFTKGALRW